MFVGFGDRVFFQVKLSYVVAWLLAILFTSAILLIVAIIFLLLSHALCLSNEELQWGQLQPETLLECSH